MEDIVVIGASGAIGSRFVKELHGRYPDATIHACARSDVAFEDDSIHCYYVDIESEDSIKKLSEDLPEEVDAVIVAVGILHDAHVMPEKALKELTAEKFEKLFAANTIGPALLAKHLLPKLSRQKRGLFAVLSARVGSISDNYLGGWYAYRASKAALNMVIKNAAIEMARTHKKAVIVGLHPGTVDSDLSEPFQANVPEGKLFTPEHSVSQLVDVLEGLTPEDSGKCFAYDGQEIAP